MKRHYTLLRHVRTYDIKKVPISTWPLQSTIRSFAHVTPYKGVCKLDNLFKPKVTNTINFHWFWRIRST